ncbi:helix-turn-helix domain-containing protein [Actinoplanes sp. NPDC000266]
MSSAPGTPADSEEPVGAALARMRRERNLTGATVAERVGMSQPKISRIERGKGAADPEDVALIARTLGASESETQALKERAERGERAYNRLTDWRPTSANLAGRQSTLAEWESNASEIRDFQPALITGLLQSSGYARAALAGFQLAPRSGNATQNREAGLRNAVAARIGRQEALADGTKSFHFVFLESVLRNRICSPVDMLAQISSLRELNDLPNVRIAIVPDDAEIEVPALHGFVVYDEDLVVIDLFNTGLTTRGRRDVAEYREVFEAFARHATADVPATLARYHDYYLAQIERG